MKYKRIVLKLSGEALAVGCQGLYHYPFLEEIAQVLLECRRQGVQLSVIVGGGNIWRGRQGTEMDRCRADQMGMLATVINAIALQDAFSRAGLPVRVMTATEMNPFTELYTREKAVAALEQGEVVIFGGGLGSPYFSTDTAAALRAAEIGADALLMAKNIDGIYDRDPNAPDGGCARKFDTISAGYLIAHQLHAIDLTAAALNMESKIPTVVFGLHPPHNILQAVAGEPIGTLITTD
ncbi:MAG: UMP kinase [Eubacteriales bacterium]